MRLRQRSDESGFTLVELLVVIIIIGILASIAIPVFLNQRKRANDADLKQSMRTVAQAYNEWTIEPANSNAVFATHSLDRRVVFAEGSEQTLYPVPANHAYLKDFPGMSPFSIHPKAFFEIFVNHQPGTTGTYQEIYQEDEFCIVGRMENSNYDHRTGAGLTAANYDKLLYWDSNLGGLKEMKDMIAAKQRGESPTCYEHVKQYMEAHGIA